MADIDADHFGQIFWQSSNANLEQDVFEHAAAGLDPLGFTDGFDRNHDGDFLIFGDFVEIDVQDLATQRVMLHFLDQGEPFRPCIVLDLEVHQQVFGDRMVDEVFHFFGDDFELLGLSLTAIDDGGDAAGSAQLLGPSPPRQRPRECVQCYGFHACLNQLCFLGARRMFHPSLPIQRFNLLTF